MCAGRGEYDRPSMSKTPFAKSALPNLKLNSEGRDGETWRLAGMTGVKKPSSSSMGSKACSERPSTAMMDCDCRWVVRCFSFCSLVPWEVELFFSSSDEMASVIDGARCDGRTPVESEDCVDFDFGESDAESPDMSFVVRMAENDIELLTPYVKLEGRGETVGGEVVGRWRFLSLFGVRDEVVEEDGGSWTSLAGMLSEALSSSATI